MAMALRRSAREAAETIRVRSADASEPHGRIRPAASEAIDGGQLVGADLVFAGVDVESDKLASVAGAESGLDDPLVQRITAASELAAVIELLRGPCACHARKCREFGR